MRLLEDWQYKYIEKCLYDYKKLTISSLPTEREMAGAISDTLSFFSEAPHEQMITEYYIKADIHRKHYTKAGHFHWVCVEIIHTEEPNGYVMRKEIIYRVAMYCYARGIFKTKVEG